MLEQNIAFLLLHSNSVPQCPQTFFIAYKPFFSNLTLCSFYLLRFAKFIKLFYWNSLYFTSFFIFNCNFCVFNHTLSSLAASYYDRTVLIYEKIKKFFLLRIRVYDLKTRIQADYAKILSREIINIALALRYLHYAVLELLFGDPILFPELLYVRKLFVLV